MEKAFLVFIFAFLSSSMSHGYPNFIGYGYSSCITCHFNGFGNGPLSDYGRMLGATTIAGRAFSTSSDEEVAEQSGFLGRTPMPDWFRASIGWRSMYFTRNLQNQPTNRYITMQGEGSFVLKFGPKDQMHIVTTYGYAPSPRISTAGDPSTKSNYISREHYFSYNFTKTWKTYIGMMDKVFGLRVPDHVAFSRQQTLNAQNDQVHGAVVQHLGKTFEAGIHGFAGNLFQESELRTQGASGQAEFELAENIRVGGSALSMKNNFVQNNVASVHGRFGYGHGSSIISEVGAIQRNPKSGSNTLGGYIFVQGLLAMGDGLHFLNTFEYFTNDTTEIQSRQFRFTPGIQYFPTQRVELRVEAVNSRNFNPDTVQGDTWDMMSQLHLWF